MKNLAEELMRSISMGNMAWPILLSLVAGFLTALSPCVYPLVPITLSIMGAGQYKSRIHGFLIASSYALGMCLVYSSLGVLFASLGILLGSFMQSPAMLLALAIFFALMALSMFGVLPIVIPPRLAKFFSHIGGRGFKGAFLMGMVAGLIAAPCTGPVLGFILALIAEKQNIMGGLWLMISFSLGLSFPFLALGSFSSAIAHMPKSGRWMVGIKIFLGLTMLGTSFYFAYQAAPKSPSTASSDGLTWHTIDANTANLDINYYFNLANNLNKPVLIDFYADWCIACQQLENITYKNNRVKKILSDFFLLKIDASKDSFVISNIEKHFMITGLPTTLLFKVGNNQDPVRLYGYIKSEEFLEHLKEVLTEKIDHN